MKEDSESLENDSPEEIADSESQAPAEELQEQARRLRVAVRRDRTGPSGPSGPSFLGKILYLAFFMGVMGSTIYLLMFPAVRHDLVRQVSEVWIAASRDVTRSHIYRLPPPPPKPAEQRVVFQAPVPIVSGSNVPETGTASSGEDPDGGPRQAPALKKTRDSETAYRLLLEKSAAAKDLTEGKIPGQAFKEWRLMKDDVPVLWIDLVVAGDAGPEVHFIWSVDLETRTVTALSQAARDLDQPRSD
ncbi:MAG: hypothetical protein OXT71_12170 [Acidobacteriota bacterium]|nr:hypothetical protein [Acidobacteriota bacterium]